MKILTAKHIAKIKQDEIDRAQAELDYLNKLIEQKQKEVNKLQTVLNQGN